MIVITCLDQKNGMMFNHRRQGQDSALRERVAELVANVPLWMNHYSANQFDTESIPNLNIDDDFLQEAAQGEYCFVEDAPLAHLRSGSRESSFSDGIELIRLTSISICSLDLVAGIWLALLSLRGILTIWSQWRFMRKNEKTHDLHLPSAHALPIVVAQETGCEDDWQE